MAPLVTNDEISTHVESLMDPPEQVRLSDAVRQRIELHPQAGVQEIAAMLAYDGIDAPAELVQNVMDQQRSTRPLDAGWVHAPPAIQSQ